MALGYYYHMYRKRPLLKRWRRDDHQSPCSDMFDPEHHPSATSSSSIASCRRPATRTLLEQKYQDEFAYNPSVHRDVPARPRLPRRASRSTCGIGASAAAKKCGRVIVVGSDNKPPFRNCSVGNAQTPWRRQSPWAGRAKGQQRPNHDVAPPADSHHRRGLKSSRATRRRTSPTNNPTVSTVTPSHTSSSTLPLLDVAKAFDQKNLLIIGSTGFVGKVVAVDAPWPGIPMIGRGVCAGAPRGMARYRRRIDSSTRWQLRRPSILSVRPVGRGLPMGFLRDKVVPIAGDIGRENAVQLRRGATFAANSSARAGWTCHDQLGRAGVSFTPSLESAHADQRIAAR